MVSVKSMVQKFSQPTTTPSTTAPSPTSTTSTTPSTTILTPISKPLNDLKENNNNQNDLGNESESDLEDGLLTESIIFPKKVESEIGLSPLVEGVTLIVDQSEEEKNNNNKNSILTTSPKSISAPTPNTPSTTTTSSTTPSTTTKPAQIGDSPLASILNSIAELSAKEQEVVKKNLERLGTYPTDLPLSDSWTLYFSDTSRATKSPSGSATAEETYTESQSAIFTVNSVPGLCGSLKAYKRLVRSKRMRNNDPDTMGLAQFRPGMNLHCFRSYSKPTWEDPWNQKGGRITISPPPHLLDSTFEKLVLLLTGASLETNVSDSLLNAPSPNRKSTGPVIEGLIIGVVASKRARGDRVELWLGGKRENEPAPSEWVERLKEVLSVELEMPELRTGKYKKHF